MKGYIPDAERLALKPTGYRIRYYRLRRGLSQKQLADACDLNESTIRNYELGNRNPNLDNLTAIAAALKVSYFTLAAPSPTAPFGALHIFFDMEKLFHLHPEIIDGRVCLVSEVDDPDSALQKIIYNGIAAWAKVYEKYNSGKIDTETYLEWQAQLGYRPISASTLSDEDAATEP